MCIGREIAYVKYINTLSIPLDKPYIQHMDDFIIMLGWNFPHMSSKPTKYLLNFTFRIVTKPVLYTFLHTYAQLTYITRLPTFGQVVSKVSRKSCKYKKIN